MQFEVQLEAMGYWGAVLVRAQVFERFLCIPLMSFDLSFNSFLLLVFELKCLRSYSEFNPQFSKDISVEGCLMIFQMSPSQVTKQMATLLLVQHLSWGRFGRCCPTLRFPDFGSDFRDTTLHSTHWTIQQEGPRNEDI